MEFLCREKEFGEERIKKSLERMTAGSKKQKGKVLGILREMVSSLGVHSCTGRIVTLI